MSSYLSPRLPKVLNKHISNEELLEAAREVISRKGGRGAMGVVGPDDYVLLVTPPEPMQDSTVVDAVLTAFKEAGIRADSVSEDIVGLRGPVSMTFSAVDGWAEICWRQQNVDMLHASINERKKLELSGTYDYSKLEDYLAKNPGYTAVFFETASRSQIAGYLVGENKKKFKDNWIYHTKFDLASPYGRFPGELWHAIEVKTVENIANFEEVIIKDPEGTHIRFSVTQEEAKIWSEAALRPGHLLMYPMYAGIARYNLGKSSDEVLICPKTYGVIAGANNHAGFFPHMKAYVEDGMIVRIEGGGKFGELLNELMWKTQDKHYPRHPHPGYFYVTEVALGTHPKSFRYGQWNSYIPFSNLSERTRSGIFHWGIGVQSSKEDIKKYAQENDMPFEHGWHIHTYFNTYQAKLRNTGEWINIIDKGRLTALDDPGVRKIAEKYGDPDELLSEDWVPALPGINYPGDYMRDYGRNPAPWVWMEMQDKLPKTIGVPGV